MSNIFEKQEKKKDKGNQWKPSFLGLNIGDEENGQQNRQQEGLPKREQKSQQKKQQIRQPKRQQNRGKAQFTRNPLYIEFKLLKGNEKEFVDLVFQKDCRDRVMLNNEIMSQMNIRYSHFKNIIERLKKKGFISWKSKHGYKTYSLNPSVFQQ